MPRNASFTFPSPWQRACASSNPQGPASLIGRNRGRGSDIIVCCGHVTEMGTVPPWAGAGLTHWKVIQPGIYRGGGGEVRLKYFIRNSLGRGLNSCHYRPFGWGYQLKYPLPRIRQCFIHSSIRLANYPMWCALPLDRGRLAPVPGQNAHFDFPHFFPFDTLPVSEQ